MRFLQLGTQPLDLPIALRQLLSHEYRVRYVTAGKLLAARWNSSARTGPHRGSHRNARTTCGGE
jgi:hypothetical protein